MDTTQLYKSAQNYFLGPDNMKNEVLMWFTASGLLMQELSKGLGNLPFGGLKNKIGHRERNKVKSIEVLDMCSGPGNFVNHLAFVLPNIKVVCVDINAGFVEYGKRRFRRWKFVQGDVTKISLRKKFRFIVASSAYHHIPDNQKLDFLCNIRKHLTNDGVVIMCDNFLPNYSGKNKQQAAKSYYSELRKWYCHGNATPEAIRVIKGVERTELEGCEEYKVPFKIFLAQLKKAGLIIDTDIAVWQPYQFAKDNAGSHVLILKINKK
ncbi:class I SAM-dependent methyltransferase [Patescibacteria group bacterium]|nr:class I SAM-dependent methyltransferase [Patescibacteria group bacterium]